MVWLGKLSGGCELFVACEGGCGCWLWMLDLRFTVRRGANFIDLEHESIMVIVLPTHTVLSKGFFVNRERMWQRTMP